MTVLVTGANGYIGSKTVSVLCEKGVKVIAADVAFQNVDKRAMQIYADILTERDDWYSYFKQPDVCLHMAWRDGFIHNSTKHMGDLSTHYRFLHNLAANGMKQIAVMGTMHEIGYFEGKVDENTPCNPQSNYGIAKNALRQATEQLCKENSCIFQWLRAYYIFGNDDTGNSVFCKIRQAARRGEKTFPFTSGKNEYDFIHIDELARQIAACVTQKEVKGIINVCSGKPVSLARQIEGYIKENGLPIALDYGKYPDRAYDSPCIYGDNTKIKRILGL